METIVRCLESTGETPIVARGRTETGELKAVWPLKLDGRRVLRFLQYIHCDQCTCIYLPDISATELAEGLLTVIQSIKPQDVVFKYVPDWGLTLHATLQALGKAGWRFQQFPADVCPTLESKDGDEGRTLLAAKFDTRKLRWKTKKLGRTEGFSFQIDDTADGLDEWVDEFCDAHVLRWGETDTPSRYHDATARRNLHRVLQAWAADGILLRFTMTIEGRKAAFVIGLRRNHRLIRHHSARLPVYDKWGVGTIMIRLMGLWMVENGFSCMDFGLGDEPYKYEFATHNEPLWRIYGGSSVLSGKYLYGCAKTFVRKSEARQKLWKQLANSSLGQRMSGWKESL